MEIVITSPEEEYKNWYCNHLLGGIVTPYTGYIAGSKRYIKSSLINFCKVNCPNKFNKKGQFLCKKECEKHYKFNYLMNIN